MSERELVYGSPEPTAEEVPLPRPIDPSKELLFRQVNPSWIRQGRVTSQAFRPTDKDKGLLSVSRQSVSTAEAAFKHFVDVLKCSSAGVYAVSIKECAALGLTTHHTPRLSPPVDPSHCDVNFKGCGKAELETKSQMLAAIARDRECQYPKAEAYQSTRREPTEPRQAE